MDVYAGPNQSLIIIGVTAKGTIWKKELYKGFFDIFEYASRLGEDKKKKRKSTTKRLK